MSTATTMLIATSASNLCASPRPSVTALSCPSCGTAVPGLSEQSEDAAYRRIAELESQVRMLTEKASAAADKLADCEDELCRLRASHAGSTAVAEPCAGSSDANRPHTANPEGSPARMSRITSLLARRKSSPFLATAFAHSGTTPSLPGAPSKEVELRSALEKEKGLRQQAEGKVSAMSTEIEELSVTLFQQANDMVSEERRARAKLEERVEMLEKRDKDKKTRLERLETAIQRIERVRSLL